MSTDELCSMAFGFVFGLILASVVTAACLSTSWNKWAIDRGVAEYNAKTGEWTEKPFDCECESEAE